MTKPNWFDTLHEALDSEKLCDSWDPMFPPVEYGETRHYTFEDLKAGRYHHVSIYRDNRTGRYERPVHYTSTKLPDFRRSDGDRDSAECRFLPRKGDVLPNGARLVALYMTGDGSGVVLAESTLKEEWVTWEFYSNDLKTTSNGHYSDDLEAASKDFSTRVKNRLG